MRSSKTSRSNSTLTLVSVAVIVIFAVICAFAAVPKLSEHIENKEIASGSKEPTVAYQARQAGMSVEDYLAQYGLTLGGDVTKQTTLNDLSNNMTISNYVNFVNDMNKSTDENGNVDESSKLDVDSYLSQYSDAVTADTTIKDLNAMSAETALGTDTFNMQKQLYNLGDEITSETSLEDFGTAIQDAIRATQEEAANATPAPDSSAAPDAAAAEGDTQATEVPAETPAE